MAKILLSLFFFTYAFACFSQGMDELMRLRKTDSLDGKIKTFYTPGNKKIAERLQNLITSATLFYEKKYSKPFDLKLAVLDSAQWVNEVLPYGFVFHENGWIVMNTGMNYESFKRIY